MEKHTSFWIGFFCAALIIVPIAVGILGAVEEHAETLAIAAIGGVTGLVLVLVAVLLLRNWFLRKLFGRTEVALSEVTSSLISTVSAATTGDRHAAEEKAKETVIKATNWYSWTSFYRWVIASAIGLLFAFGAFVGTVLLFEQVRLLTEQTERFKKQTELMDAQTTLMAEQTVTLTDQNDQVALQNEILTLSLVSELRSQLLSSTQEIDWVANLIRNGDLNPDRRFLDSSDNNCSARFVETVPLVMPPSRSTILAIASLGREGSLAPKVREALSFLALDGDPSVRLGALMIGDELGIELVQGAQDEPMHSFEGLFIDELVLTKPYSLTFEGSVIEGLFCDDCIVSYDRSVVGPDATANEFAPNRYARDSVIVVGFNTLPEFGVDGGSLIFRDQDVNEAELPHSFESKNNRFFFDAKGYLTDLPRLLDDTQPSEACASLNFFLFAHPFFEYIEP